jgi:hypothetical protein
MELLEGTPEEMREKAIRHYVHVIDAVEEDLKSLELKGRVRMVDLPPIDEPKRIYQRYMIRVEIDDEVIELPVCDLTIVKERNKAYLWLRSIEEVLDLLYDELRTRFFRKLYGRA